MLFRPLPDPSVTIREKRSSLSDQVKSSRYVKDISGPRNDLIVHDVEFSRFEWSGAFVLDDTDAGTVAHHFGSNLDGLNSADIQTNAGVEFQGETARGCLGVPKHHADLLTKLVG